MINARARDIFEKNKLRGAKSRTTRTFSVREWLLALFAFGSLAVTSLSQYLVTFRTVDEIRVVFSELPTIELGGDVAIIHPSLKMTFINSGNRNAVILNTFIRVVEDAPCDSRFDTVAQIDLPTDPFVLKVNDIVMRSADPKDRSHRWQFTGSMNAPPSGQRVTHNASLCLNVEFATSNFHNTAILRLRYIENPLSLFQRDERPEHAYNRVDPWRMFKETGNVFLPSRPHPTGTFLEKSTL